VKGAFAQANEAEATLLIAFIGHGVANPNLGFYLLANDSDPDEPTSETAFDVTTFLGERLNYSPYLDGLILLIDACEAGQGVQGAAQRWIKLLADNGSRMDLLVASGDGNAYNGCFTKSILSTFETGLDSCGDNLLCRDLRTPISNVCVAQPQGLDFDGAERKTEDRGLWLVPNKARGRDAVFGRPGAGLVDQLTRGLIVTDSMREKLAKITDAADRRLRLIVGAAGSGKSTLMATLIRPKLVSTLTIPVGYIKAAVFLDKTSTIESLAGEMNAQLAVTLPDETNTQGTVTQPGFRKAILEATGTLSGTTLNQLGSFDTAVRLPLAWLKSKRPGLIVPVIVDGLDQPAPGARDLILAALQQLTETTPSTELGHVRVIAGIRSGEGLEFRDELKKARRITITQPKRREIAEAVSSQSGVRLSAADLAKITTDLGGGGWLIARLVGEIVHDTGALPASGLAELTNVLLDRVLPPDLPDGDEGARVLSVIAAAGIGPVLPLRLLADALDQNEVVALGRLRGHILRMAELISRGNPGTDAETVGISHLALLNPITNYISRRYGWPTEWAHRALIDGYQQRQSAVAPNADSTVPFDDVSAYWMTAAPRHYIAASDPQGAYSFIRKLETARAAENRDRWSTWAPAFAAALGLNDAITLRARASLARWRGLAGDAHGAKDDFRELVDAYTLVLGEHARETLSARSSWARWRAEDHEEAEAVQAYRDVLKDQIEVLGADDSDTLKTRNNYAHVLAMRKNFDEAAAQCQAILESYAQRRRKQDDVSLAARGNLAGFLGDAKDPRGAIDQYRVLLKDQKRVLGADNRATLTTRTNIAYFLARINDLDRAIAEYEAVLADQERVLTAEDPDTVLTRSNLAYWRERRAGRTAAGGDAS
jgi:tetratricopeptide (TPR) repeat protein